MKYFLCYDKVLVDEKLYLNIFMLEFVGGVLMDFGVYVVYGVVILFGVLDSVVYFLIMIKFGVDGMGMVILIYDQFVVILNFGKIVNFYLVFEIYGLKDILVFDLIFDIIKVIYFDVNQELMELEVLYFENLMVDELNDFVVLFNVLDDLE